MNNKLAFVLGLVAGGAVGTVVSWRLLKAKYKKIADEEIASMKEVLARKIAEQPEEVELEEVLEKEPIPAIPKEYLDMTTRYTNGEVLGVSEDQKPYIISPDEFGDHDEYDTATLVYYADNVLAYYTGEVVENVRAEVGTEFMNHFGDDENDPDTVYIRNDVMKFDYEILRDQGKFSDVMKSKYQDDTEE